MHITDSYEALFAALKEHEGTVREPRVRLLLTLKESPHLGVTAAFEALKIAESTGHRWLSIYSKGGLQQLLAIQGRRSRESKASLPQAGENGDVQRLLEFLGDLPITTDSMQWCRQLQGKLLLLLNDVDRIVVNVQTTTDLLDPTTNKVGVVYHQQDYEGVKSVRAQTVRRQQEMLAPWQMVFQQGIRTGFPAEHYHKPIGYDYFYHTEEAYLGSIILLRRKENPVISRSTLARLQELQQFMVFLFSDHIARQRQPSDLSFRDLTSRIAADAQQHLTTREEEVLCLLVTSHSYREIGSQLFISPQTVRKYVHRILRKTDARNVRELLARYTTPRSTYPRRSPESLR